MRMIYNSEYYSVFEYSADSDHEALRFGGFEITDKSVKREWFIGGPHAQNFRTEVAELIGSKPSTEEIDEFLGQYDEFMNNAISFH